MKLLRWTTKRGRSAHTHTHTGTHPKVYKAQLYSGQWHRPQQNAQSDGHRFSFTLGAAAGQMQGNEWDACKHTDRDTAMRNEQKDAISSMNYGVNNQYGKIKITHRHSKLIDGVHLLGPWHLIPSDRADNPFVE